jgi:hypothetical protein
LAFNVGRGFGVVMTTLNEVDVGVASAAAFDGGAGVEASAVLGAGVGVAVGMTFGAGLDVDVDVAFDVEIRIEATVALTGRISLRSEVALDGSIDEGLTPDVCIGVGRGVITTSSFNVAPQPANSELTKSTSKIHRVVLFIVTSLAVWHPHGSAYPEYTTPMFRPCFPPVTIR